jgi:hypothetical protein
MGVRTETEGYAALSPRRAEGERALLRAVLVDGVRCLFGEAGGPPSTRVRLMAEARTWIAKRNDAQPFSFENVCGWLGLPVERLRRTLLERVASMAADAVDDDGPGDSRRPGSFADSLRRERNARIRALRKAGGKPRDIAEQVGMAYTSILQICAADDGNEQSGAAYDTVAGGSG